MLNMRKRIITIGLLMLHIVLLWGQVYIEGGKTRHRFAQLNIGTDIRYYPGTLSKQTDNVQNYSSSLPGTIQNSIVIGGTHFWGHADFFVSIPVISSYGKEFRPGVETAFRYFPWAIQKDKIRPFVGVSWMPTSVRIGEGSNLERNEWPVQAGFLWQKGSFLIDLAAAYSFKKDVQYYLSPTQVNTVSSHPLRFSLGLKWSFDTTIGAERDWKSGRTAYLTDTLGSLKRLNSFTIGIGPSSAQFLRTSSHIDDNVPFFHQPERNKIFPEFGLGYYLHKPDLQFNLAYRSIHAHKNALGMEQIATRRSLTLEVYRFTWDYHGFVPFVGPCLSLEGLTLQEKLPLATSISYANTIVRPGITFGWDIRPNRLQVFYLRTHLRWIPNLHLSTRNNKKFSFDQLEFNFIQAVFLLNRL